MTIAVKIESSKSYTTTNATYRSAELPTRQEQIIKLPHARTFEVKSLCASAGPHRLRQRVRKFLHHLQILPPTSFTSCSSSYNYYKILQTSTISTYTIYPSATIRTNTLRNITVTCLIVKISSVYHKCLSCLNTLQLDCKTTKHFSITLLISSCRLDYHPYSTADEVGIFFAKIYHELYTTSPKK